MPRSSRSARPLHVGVISDTHGLMRPQALAAWAGSDAIVHAGDIGDASILAALARIAPVTAVRGNNDAGAWATGLPDRATLRIGGRAIFVLHNLADLAIEPAPRDVAVIVAGHSHRPSIRNDAGVLHVNPGSAGPRRFRLPIALARLVVSPAEVACEIVLLDRDAS